MSDIAEQMIKDFIGKAVGPSSRFQGMKWWLRALRCDHGRARALRDAAANSGAYHVQPIEEPMAAAIGAGLR